MSKWPEHENPKSAKRTAHAPYNFVPLPEQVVKAVDDPAELPDQDRYYPERCTGQIHCTLTTESPLFIRAALTWKEFEDSQNTEEQAKKSFRDRVKNKPEFFYDPATGNPLIPGSSLRGMLRALVEIVSYSKVQWATDQQRYFFRAVAAPKSDPLALPYREALGKVQAGYVVQDGPNWYVLPAYTLAGNSFLSVRETAIPPSVLPRKQRFSSPDYKPGYYDLSFTTRPAKRGGLMVGDVADPGTKDYYPGVLVCTGNMGETAETTDGKVKSPRRRHHIVLMPRPLEKKNLIRIDPDAVVDYRQGLTDFVREHYDEQNGCLRPGYPIFYMIDPADGVIRDFGHTPNFRIAYRRPFGARASSPLDFVPKELRREEDIDLAEAIFGYTKSTGEGKARAYAGRVFIEDARLTGDPKQAREERVVVPRILGTPKPTTFQHYLVQPEPDDSAKLRHYASQTPDQTVIRGHKLYWHQGNIPLEQIEESKDKLPKDEKEEIKETQHTQMQPVKPKVEFKFTIRFENLSDIELGALLWALRLAGDKDHRLKLGMGKPYGMGAVRIAYDLEVEDRAARYGMLFDGGDWAAPVRNVDEDEAVRAFEDKILQNQAINPGRRAKTLADLPRIKELLAMLRWEGPDPKKTEYMRIEPENEYKGRPALPKASDIG